MKRWFTVLIIGALALGALVWFIPASWALPLVQSQWRGVQLEGVSGTLWQGRAEQVSIGSGPSLGSLAWTLSHRALLGDLQLGFDLRQPQLQAQGQLHRVSAAEVELHDITVHMDAALLGPQPWLHGQPQGQLDLQVAQAQLQGHWPMQLDATGTWSQASLRTAAGEVALGAVSLAMTGHAGALQGVLSDDGSGIVQTAGRLSLSPLGWDLQLRLVPRGENPALMQWLHSLGTPAADGTLDLRYRGGLAQWNPGKP